MIPAKTAPTVDAIRRHLAQAGWSVSRTEQPFEHEWWAAEFWVLESEWSPKGNRVWLTFLTDPMGGPDDVWAVQASATRPVQRPVGGSDPLTKLSTGWQKEMSSFVLALSRFRDTRGSDAPSGK